MTNSPSTLLALSLLSLRSRLRRFRRGERGSMTVHGLFMFTASCLIGAAGLDVTHVYAARSQLQVAADVAAHAALFRRNQGTTTAATAKLDAIAAVEVGMAPATYGHVLTDADIVFGTYNATTRTFTASATSRAAVQVRVGRADARANPVSSFLFRLAGVTDFDVVAASTFAIYQPACLREGFVAEGIVDIQSNNSYYKGFCVHSNSYVSANQNNFFELGTVVSMPDTTQLSIPASGFAKNTGLSEALRSGYYRLRILDRVRAGAVDPLLTAITTLGTPDTPPYLTSASAIALTTSNLSPANFTTGRVHTRTCSGGGSLSLGGGTYSRVVLTTNCIVNINGGAILQDMVVFTTSTDAQSVKINTAGGGGFQLGKNDNCAPGGGAQIVTRGGFKQSAKMDVYNGQIIALGAVDFAAQATGNGVSIVAGGMIDGTTNMSMTSCPSGQEDNFEAAYFRLAG